MPGRGAAGGPGLVSFATKSGRGGTTGRAAGCPTRLGRDGRGAPGVTAGPAAAAGVAAAAVLGGAGFGAGARGGAGSDGPGRIAPAAELGRASSPSSAGSGWRGPERICPGLGAGTGRPEIGGRAAGGGGGGTTSGAGGAGTAGAARPGILPASGGRRGCGAGRVTRDSSIPGTASDTGGGGASCCNSGRAGAVWEATIGAMSAPGAAGGATGSVVSTGSAGTGRGTGVTPKCLRISSATSSSTELECVFFSETPSSGNSSRILFGFTSSSLASSLIRILLIRPLLLLLAR